MSMADETVGYGNAVHSPQPRSVRDSRAGEGMPLLAKTHPEAVKRAKSRIEIRQPHFSILRTKAGIADFTAAGASQQKAQGKLYFCRTTNRQSKREDLLEV